MLKEKPYYDVILIGGGFFGCVIALHLKKYFKRILILEKNDDILKNASRNNQARIHNGYHYPRSLLTALRSHVNFPKFNKDFSNCLKKDFDKYYAIPFVNSNITASQFAAFCRKVKIPIDAAPKNVKALFNRDTIEEVFKTCEYVYNAEKLRTLLLNRLKTAGIDVCLNCEAKTLSEENNRLAISVKNRAGSKKVVAERVFNCTYSSINSLNINSGLPIIPLRHELTEMAIVSVPKPFQTLGITVMCGSFFSLLPFPILPGLFCLTHVKYTPHLEWDDTQEIKYLNRNEALTNIKLASNYVYMIKDVARYLPIGEKCKYVRSIWEVKTILPQSDFNDSRPILFSTNHGLKNYTCVLGGKIDNVYDVLEELDNSYE